MFCPNCGRSMPDGSAFCTNCGNPLSGGTQPSAPASPPDPSFSTGFQSDPPFGGYQPQQPDPSFSGGFQGGPAYNTPYGAPQNYGGTRMTGELVRLKSLLSGPLFLVTCIVFSLGVLLELISFSAFNLVDIVLSILFCVALWICFGTAQNRSGSFSTSGLRFASGTLKAQFIVNWVDIGAWAIIGPIIAIILLAVGYDVTTTIGILLFFIVLIVLAVKVLINILLFGNLKRFTSSVITSAETGVASYDRAGPSRVWLIIFGALGCCSLFSFLFTLIIRGSLYELYSAMYYLPDTFSNVFGHFLGGSIVGTLASVFKGAAGILAAILVGQTARR